MIVCIADYKSSVEQWCVCVCACACGCVDMITYSQVKGKSRAQSVRTAATERIKKVNK